MTEGRDTGANKENSFTINPSKSLRKDELCKEPSEIRVNTAEENATTSPRTELLMVNGKIAGMPVEFLIDGGSQANLISYKTATLSKVKAKNIPNATIR